jgi:hypothetical protein
MDRRLVFKLNGERKSWARLYDCTEPSCMAPVKLSPSFWWLREREPWRRISAEIAAANNAMMMMTTAAVALRTQMAYARTSARQRETCH